MIVSLLAGFGLSLLLVWCIDAYRTGRRRYGIAVAGIAFALLGRMMRDYASPAEELGLQAVGLALFAAILAFDLLTEEIPIEDDVLASDPGSANSPPL
jgi:hypothetical protein